MATEPRDGKPPELILDEYVDILNIHGPESRQERSFLAKHASDPKALRLLKTTRALKALYHSFDMDEAAAASTHSTSAGRR